MLKLPFLSIWQAQKLRINRAYQKKDDLSIRWKIQLWARVLESSKFSSFFIFEGKNTSLFSTRVKLCSQLIAEWHQQVKMMVEKISVPWVWYYAPICVKALKIWCWIKILSNKTRNLPNLANHMNKKYKPCSMYTHSFL